MGSESSENEELNAARKEHDDAHQAVQEAAAAAQEAHDLMIQWDKEVNKQRESVRTQNIVNYEIQSRKPIRLIDSTSYLYDVCTPSKT